MAKESTQDNWNRLIDIAANTIAPGVGPFLAAPFKTAEGDLISPAVSLLQPLIEPIVETVWKNVKGVWQPVKEYSELVADAIVDGLNLPGDTAAEEKPFKDALKKLLPNMGPLDVLIALAFGLFYYASYAKEFGDIANIEAQYGLRDKLRPMILSPQDFARILWRPRAGESWESLFETWAGWAGYRSEAIEGIKEGFRPWPDLPMIQEWTRRNAMPSESLLRLYSAQGWAKEHIPYLQTLSWRLIEPAAIQALWERGHYSDQRALEELRHNGYDGMVGTDMLKSFHQRLPLETIQVGYWRGRLDPDRTLDELRKWGFREWYPEAIRDTWNLIPPIQDIIAMAVHEVFPAGGGEGQSEASMRYGLRDAFPAVVEKYAGMQGFAPEWAMRYWENHWQWPGMNLVQQMLYRVPEFTEADATRILRYSDYPPGLLPQLLQVLYQPFTRRDIRRMHDVGVLNVEQVYRAHLDLGYTPENAAHMTDFTVALNERPDLMSARTEVINAYKDRILERSQAESALKELGFKSDRAETFLDQAKVERSLEEESNRVQSVQARYVTWRLRESEARAELTAMGYTSDRVTRLIDAWKPDRTDRQKTPSRTDLTRWLRKGLIDESTFLDKMGRIGYSIEDADLYLADATGGTT